MAKKQFKAESKRLMDLMINSIYTNKEIFLREIISNASDAIDKLRYTALTDEKAREFVSDLHIKVTADKENRTVTISDNGIGMTAQDLENNLGVIARSGSLKFKENIENENEQTNIIGQFGVGFYSAFMVSDNVKVISRNYLEDTASIWESDGVEGYTVKPYEKKSCGTDIIMHIKPDTDDEKYGEFLDEYRIKGLIKRYSDYITYPIKMDLTVNDAPTQENAEPSSHKEEQTVNSMIPLWKKSKADLKDEECESFYKERFYDSEAPAVTIHISTEGIVSYNALLFVPKKAPYDYYSKDFEKGLQLYSNGVLIMDKCADLLPDCFRFVRGVVDSEDLSLNISREMLQHDRQLKTIASSLEKKIKSELKKKLENDREDYEKFFKEFGLQLKYGVVADYGLSKDKVQDLLLFYSDKKQGMITLDEYIADMSEEQKYIYYACGESVQKINALPQAELVRNKGYDLLCFTDDVDEFVVNTISKVNDKEFRSLDAENDELLDDSDKEKTEKAAKDNEELLTFAKETLSDKVSKVVVSKKLKTHPVCLSTEGGVSIEMEKYFATMPGDNAKPKAQKVLELNAEHPAFEALKTAYESDKDRAKTLCEVLYNQALLIAGLPIDDPTGYSELVCSLIK